MARLKLIMKADGSSESVNMDAAAEAARAAEEQEWADNATSRNALKVISDLEAEITSRRIREHALGIENPANWLADQEILIAAERVKL